MARVRKVKQCGLIDLKEIRTNILQCSKCGIVYENDDSFLSKERLRQFRELPRRRK